MAGGKTGIYFGRSRNSIAGSNKVTERQKEHSVKSRKPLKPQRFHAVSVSVGFAIKVLKS